MIRLLGAVGAAIIAVAPFAMSQSFDSSCDTGELEGGQRGPCVLSIQTTPAGGLEVRRAQVRMPSKAKVYYGVTPDAADVAVIRGVVSASPALAPAAQQKPVCAYDIRRVEDRIDGQRRFNVCVDDVSALKTPEDVEQLYSRIERAAEMACPRDGRRVSSSAQRRCIRSVLRNTIDAAGIEELAMHAAVERGRDTTQRVAIVGPVAN